MTQKLIKHYFGIKNLIEYRFLPFSGLIRVNKWLFSNYFLFYMGSVKFKGITGLDEFNTCIWEPKFKLTQGSMLVLYGTN